MVSGLANLISKEIKEMLRDPKVILSVVLMPLIMFPVMGAAMRLSTTAIEQSMKSMSLALMDLDKGPAAENLISSFRTFNVTIMNVSVPTVNEALTELGGSNVTTLLVIPIGFSQNLSSGLRGELQVYSIIKGMSLAESAISSATTVPISAYENVLVYNAIGQAFPGRSPETVLDPIDVQSAAVIKGVVVKVSPDILRSLFLSQSLGFPMAIMILLISVMQIGATTISVEKEEKTLETLLTLPISRLNILTGKLVGSVIVALAGAVSAMIGISYYTTSVTNLMPTDNLNLDLSALGLALSPIAYILLSIMVFVTIVSALALAICIAAFSDNVRSAQSMVGPLSILVILPSMVLMFADVEMLPPAVQTMLYAIPYTHSVIAFKAAFMGDYLAMLEGIAYVSAFTVAVLYVTAKLFTTERIVSAKISFRGLKIRR